MKTELIKSRRPAFAPGRSGWWPVGTLLAASLLTAGKLTAMPEVETLTGGPSQFYPQTPYGYVNGFTDSEAKFRTPFGLALDSTANNMFVADRDNNAVRQLDLLGNQTYTFVPNAFIPTNLIVQPVGVAVDSVGDVYVLNRGNGNNGTVLQFNSYGDLVRTNATGLINAAGIAVDGIGTLYLTVQNNTVLQIAPNGTQTILATIAEAGAALRGIVFKRDGMLAACDAGRHGIYLIDPISGVVSTNAGFHGAGDFTTANNVASSATAMFNQPYGVTEAGDGTLVVADYGNHRVKVVLTSGVVTNLYGVSSSLWYGPADPSQGIFPGWWDGTVTVPDLLGGVEARQPVGVVFAPDGTIYATETYYHLIRKVTSTGLPQPPPPPPQVPSPVIGWVDFPYPDFLSQLHAGTSFVFNNDVILAIQGTAGSQTFFTVGPKPPTGSIPDPTPAVNDGTPPPYADNLPSSQVVDLPVTRYPDMLIKAVGAKNDGSPPSEIVQARIQFVVANPTILGNNAASFSITNLTLGAAMWYTVDGTEPTNAPPSLGPIYNYGSLSLNASTDFTFKIRGFRSGYQPSGVVSKIFSTTNFLPNRISFGLTNGEPSSSFIARPGQFFYSPVTLQMQPEGDTMYSLQFNVTVTNGLTNPNTGVRPPVIVNGAGIDFFSMLVADVTKDRADHNPPPDFNWYLTIPPFLMSGISNQVGHSLFVNTNNNLLGVGWLFRPSFEYLVWNTNTGEYLLDYNTTKHDLIRYSIAHDTLFNKDQGVVVVGAYSFQVPNTATDADKYFIQLGSPSATRDGVGAPGAEVFIQSPLASQGITVGSPTYLVGDVAPFHWLNAGDFGQGYLNNADVMQVFQSAILYLHVPPLNSDLYLAMDSCGRRGVYDAINQYYTEGALFPDSVTNGSDPTIDEVAFGDGDLDVRDVFVTFRRSLDPSLKWFVRYWTNNQFVAVETPNLAYNSNTPSLLSLGASVAEGGEGPAGGEPTSYDLSSISFTAGDAVASPGQTINVPISANILGGHPLRVLGLNLTVRPLDGSPEITQQVQFAPAAALGSPTIPWSKHPANYSGAWLDTGIAGLSGNANLGTLQVTLPTNCPASAAYAIRFDHVSASPNGLVAFPKHIWTGLITLSDRSASSWNDGIPDSWRLRFFGTIQNLLSAATADADGDGANSWQEYKSGTNPNDAASVLRLRMNREASQGLVIRWPSSPNKQYVVERAPTLDSPTWTCLSTNAGTGADIEFHDSSSGPATRFYRVRPLD